MVEKNGLFDNAKYLFEVSFIGLSFLLPLITSTYYQDKNQQSITSLVVAMGFLFLTVISSLVCSVSRHFKGFHYTTRWSFVFSLISFSLSLILFMINFFPYLRPHFIMNFLDYLHSFNDTEKSHLIIISLAVLFIPCILEVILKVRLFFQKRKKFEKAF